MNLKRNIYDHLAKWIGEVQLQSPLAKEEIDENIEPSKDIRERIIDDIKYLDKKIDYNANEWKAWDLLNIIDSCSSDSEIDNKIANLAPNTGLVINGTLSRYNRGDIIFKKGDGNIILVPSESQGLYFPTSIERVTGSETYAITFAYAEETTEETITVNIGSGEVAKSAGSSITFEGFNTASASQAISYEHIFLTGTEEQPFLFPIKKYDADIIWPVIRCYDANGEIVECEFILKEVGNNFSISDVPSIVSKVVVR